MTGDNSGSAIYLACQNQQEAYEEYEQFSRSYCGNYNFSGWLRESLGRNTTCQELASVIGVGKGTVSKWWTGACLPGRENLILLLLYFSVPLDTAQRVLTRMGYCSALYAKDPADAAAILLLYIAGQRSTSVGKLLNSLKLSSAYAALAEQCRQWTSEGPEEDSARREAGAADTPPETEVLLSQDLLPKAPASDWQAHLQHYCRHTLFFYHRNRLERLGAYVRQWTGWTPDTRQASAAFLSYLGVQWDAERILHQLENLSKRRTLPKRDTVILWGLKLGMPAFVIDDLLSEGGYAPLGMADVDGTREKYGQNGGLEGALKLALNALLNAFPSLFPGWPAAVGRTQRDFPAYEMAKKKESAFRKLMVSAHLLTKDFTPCYQVSESSLKLAQWQSIDGGDLATTDGSAFRNQAVVYLMLSGPLNKDGIKTFVRHIIRSMNLPYEEIPVWMTDPQE